MNTNLVEYKQTIWFLKIKQGQRLKHNDQLSTVILSIFVSGDKKSVSDVVTMLQ